MDKGDRVGEDAIKYDGAMPRPDVWKPPPQTPVGARPKLRLP